MRFEDYSGDIRKAKAGHQESSETIALREQVLHSKEKCIRIKVYIDTPAGKTDEQERRRIVHKLRQIASRCNVSMEIGDATDDGMLSFMAKDKVPARTTKPTG